MRGAAELRLDTPSDLVDGLTIAAQVEHLVLVQYLFAAFSVKRSIEEGLAPAQLEQVTRWSRAILQITHDEMAHLATVETLLGAIGGGPEVDRPVDPTASDAPFPVALRRLSLPTIWRFAQAEQPPDAELPPEPGTGLEGVDVAFAVGPLAGPPAFDFDFLGDLYRGIAEAIERMGDDLWIGRPDIGASDPAWGLRVSIPPVTDARSALAAVETVILQGEGARASAGPGPASHFDTFLRIFEQLSAWPAGLDPARPVVDDPVVGTDATWGTVIDHPRTAAVADAANRVYRCLLWLVGDAYAYDAPSIARRRRVRPAARHLMTGALSPLADVLSQLPASPDGPGTAGIPFQLYAPVRVATQADVRLRRCTDELLLVADVLGDREAVGDHPRLARIGEDLKLIRRNLLTGENREPGEGAG